MPSTVTVQKMIDGARARADLQNSQFCSDAELIDQISLSYAKLYSTILDKFPEFNITSQNLTLTPGTSIYSLPADFYRLRGVDINIGNQPYQLRKFSFTERNRAIGAISSRPSHYILTNTTIKLVPAPHTTGGTDSVTLWYAPVPTKLTTAGQSVDGVAGFEEYIMLDTAIYIRTKEESDISGLEIRRAQMEQIILSAMGNIDSTFPDKVVDVQRMNGDPWTWPFAATSGV